MPDWVCGGRPTRGSPLVKESEKWRLIQTWGFPTTLEGWYRLDKRLCVTTADPEERIHNATRYTPLGLESMPFPLDGLASGFEDMLREEELIGGLNFKVPAIEEVCAQDLVTEAFNELSSRNELNAEYQRVHAVAERCGY